MEKNLWCAYVFLLNGALFAIICIWYTRTTTNNTSTLVWTIIAFITDTHQCAWPHVGVADHTLSVAFLAQTTNGLSKKKKTKIMLFYVLGRYGTFNNVSSSFWEKYEWIVEFNLPTPGCLRQKIKSGWCFAISIQLNPLQKTTIYLFSIEKCRLVSVYRRPNEQFAIRPGLTVQIVMRSITRCHIDE